MAGRSPSLTNGHGPVRALLKDRAYDRIKVRLLNDDYPPGSFLSERQLAGHLGMSKTPVKAALERLVAEGFINISPQQGIVVRQPSVQEIADLYETRAALETYALRTLAGKLSADQAARVRANLQAQARLRGTGHVAKAVATDAAFHVQFIDFLGNREISRVLDQMRERMRRVITRVFHLCPARFDASCDEHTAIASAVLAGEAGRAVDLLTRHLEHGKRLILSPRDG